MARYRPKVYRQAGSDRLVVASGGSADVESGGEIDIESGGQFKVAATVAITTGGRMGPGFARYVETVQTSTPTALATYGLSLVSSSSYTGGNTRHTIAPVAGVEKKIIVVSSVTSAAIELLTTGTWDGTNNLLTIATTSGATATSITMIASTTARWRLLWVNASSNYTASAV